MTMMSDAGVRLAPFADTTVQHLPLAMHLETMQLGFHLPPSDDSRTAISGSSKLSIWEGGIGWARGGLAGCGESAENPGRPRKTCSRLSWLWNVEWLMGRPGECLFMRGCAWTSRWTTAASPRGSLPSAVSAPAQWGAGALGAWRTPHGRLASQFARLRVDMRC